MLPRYLVYGLIDPRSTMIRYVGQSSIGMTRPRKHKRKPISDTSHCANWIRSLQRISLEFAIVVLEVCLTKEQLNGAEHWWVIYGRLSGWPLTNMTAG